MANTYIQIGSTVTVGSGGAASIDFTSIPATYTDLVLKLSARATSTTIDVKINFNSTTTGYSRRNLNGNGSTVSSSSASDAWIGAIDGSNQFTDTFSNTEIYIPNYASANNKSYSVDSTAEDNATLAFATLIAGLWSNTAAITSISLSALAGSLTFAEYSTASLYGIKNS
jgi:hypothetical protein